MVVSAATKSRSNNDSRGMGLFFIFFHHIPPYINTNNNISISDTKSNTRSSSSSFSSTTNLLASKTQSTLSICGILLFITLLLFTLSTFEPTTSNTNSAALHNNKPMSRRFLQSRGNSRNALKGVSIPRLRGGGIERHFAALQGMGELYLRGSKAMTDLIVGHVSEDSSEKEIRTFIRVVFHSGLLSRADLVFVFATPALGREFGSLVRSECDSLVRLVQLGGQLGKGELGYGLTRYFRGVGEAGKEPLWGKRGNSTLVGESTRPSYGSVVGFDALELDPENSLSGFLDQVPMRLRRWACYPMLLGRVRRNFKHMGLIDVKNVLLLSDPFTQIRNRSSESVLIWSNSETVTESTRHARRKNSGKTHTDQLNSGVIVGGSRGVRRFAEAALTEIVRVSVDHKGRNRNSVTESGVVNQLVHNGHLLKSRSINLIKPTESIPDSGSLGGFNSGDPRSGFLGLAEYFSVVQRGVISGGGFDVDDVIMREICASHKFVSAVYTDCLFGWQSKLVSNGEPNLESKNIEV
ncbi:hypothetical protein RND81_12G004400 [Saponaria officinalis]|uniref:DUF7780 domain-containing protein n=1 Tax=Saponaria officinalis TaxID=3572 RepID=A0AAW1H5R8_SAPOF